MKKLVTFTTALLLSFSVFGQESKLEDFVYINTAKPIIEQVFTAAHELGHIMLHTEIKGENFLCPISGIKNPIFFNLETVSEKIIIIFI